MSINEQMLDITKRTEKVEQKMNMILNSQGHFDTDPATREKSPMGHAMGYPDFMNPHSNFMGGGYALPYGVMSPMQMGYGGFGYGMGLGASGGMPMGAYNYPDAQDKEADARMLAQKYFKV